MVIAMRIMRKLWRSLVLSLLLPLAAAEAAERRVCKSGGADFTTIQAAVDAAQPGDVIKVAAATYTEAKLVTGTPFNLYITKNIIIRGGYTCADFINQNPSANVTTIRPSTKTLSPTNQATWQFRSGEITTSFAIPNSLAAGKLNNDAIDDLVVCEGNATGPGNRTEAGAVFVFFGGAGLPALWDLAAMPASLTIYGPATNSGIGRVAVGDVNGDGKSDLVVRSITTAYIFYGPLPAGTIDLASVQANATITGLTGAWLEAGDVDGDGKADIILGLTNETAVVRGGTLAASQTIGAAAAARFTGLTPQALYAFDWHGDGKAEMVIGDQSNNRALVVVGAALSGTADVFDRAAWIITGEVTGDRFGVSAGSGDLDGDGAADLIIGSRQHLVTNHTPNFGDAGAIYVFYGANLKILSIARAANGHAILQCRGLPNQVNPLQVSPDLSPGSFAPIVPPPPAADGAGAFQYDDAGAVGQTKRFYRLSFP